jgi:hypothetical protein
VSESPEESIFSLLPDAIDFARNATSKIVTFRFNQALQAVIDKNGLPKLTAVGLDLLTALILDDKRSELGVYREESSASNAISALERAKKYFPLSFSNTPIVEGDILDIFWRHLRTDMSYRSITPDDLSDLLSALYEGVLLSKDQRRFQGSYYTPRSLAQSILEHMPIEEIDPDDRIILDGACGSGNLLRAASKRLEKLLPQGGAVRQKTDYLSTHLVGIDQDVFAVNIARKALMLANLPHDHKWIVEPANFLDVQLSKDPSIIIANPPFKGIKSRGGGEYAIEFLTKYLEILRPNGLLGIILPAPLLQNPFEAQLRRDLLEFCSILELWLLPERSIPSSNLGIAVLILRKLADDARLSTDITRVYIAHDISAKEAFVRGESISLAFTTQMNKKLHSDVKLLPSILDELWIRLKRDFNSLSEHGFKVINGVQGYSDQFSGEERKGWTRCLSFASVLEQYHFDWDAQPSQKYVNYPGKLRFPREPGHFAVPKKVVLQGERNPKNPWRLIASIDNAQLVIKESFHYILPNENNYELEIITAILNSKLANAWYSEQDIQFHIQNTLIEQLPLPNLTQSQQLRLYDLAVQIMLLKSDYKNQGSSDEVMLKRIAILVSEIDDILFDAYEITKSEREIINVLMRRRRRPGIEWMNSEVKPVEMARLSGQGDMYYVAGEVISIEQVYNRIVVDLPGLSRFFLRCPIPDAMLGWALRPGVMFEAMMPNIQAREVSALSEIYQDEGVISVDRIDLYHVVPSRSNCSIIRGKTPVLNRSSVRIGHI